MSFSVAQKTLERLEWPRLVAQLADHCRTAAAREILASQEGVFAASEAAVLERLHLTTEARGLIDQERAPGLGSLSPGLAESFTRAEKGGALSGDRLRDVAGALATLRETRSRLSETADDAPLLGDLADAIGNHGELAREIERCIDSSGEVRESASPALRHARAEGARLASDLRQRLDRMLRNDNIRAALSDDFVTVRNDRYVLPVRADMRGRVRGIVHDASNSGTTLFVEPESVVGLNNELKQAELEATREVERVLRRLSRELAQHLPALRASLSVLVQIDLALARGQLSAAMDGVEPAPDRDGRFSLRGVRHPLIPAAESVPNDIELGADFHVLVISGPNAGGKTVAMKAIALAALQLRAGLHVAADPGARVALVDALLADIGDEQDIRENLSTFSAHMANLSTVVRESTRRSLVVLDEVGVGTDPGEGAAIAQAVLEQLADRGARVVVTTHYNLLKEMAEVDERFCNASVEFDAQTLAPTYRLQLGAPGASSATTVAARMGMPTAVIERANALLDREDRQLDRMLSELSASRSALEQEQREVGRLRAEGEAARAEYRTKLERLQQRRDKLFQAMRQDLDRAFQDAHAQVAGVIRDLQRQGSAQAAAHARDRLQSLERRTQEATQELGVGEPPAPAAVGTPVDWNRARPGDPVTVRGEQQGTLETLPDRRGRVTVRAGSARLVLPADDLRTPPASERDPATDRAERVRIERAEGGRGEDGTDDAARGGWLEGDLRGLRVHEARDRVDELVDRAAAESRDGVRILHGIGTGALRSAVREQLAALPRVHNIRSGDPEHGGEGLTEADLT